MKECIYCKAVIPAHVAVYEIDFEKYLCDICFFPWLYKQTWKKCGKKFKCAKCGVTVRKDEPRYEMPDGTLYCTDDFCEFDWLEQRRVA